jgi:HAD superfamily hydrolase (TIGR01450 family)
VLLLVDLDGVVYRGHEAVPGVPTLLAARVAAGDQVVYVTNNATAHNSEYQARLEGLGAPYHPSAVVTSAQASAVWIRDNLPSVRRVLSSGAPGLAQELAEAGFDVVTAADVAELMRIERTDGYGLAGRPDAVVVGLDPEMTYLRVAAAADCVRAGAVLVATNRDPMYPTEYGFRPGAGSAVTAIETAARTPAQVDVGKPGPYLLEVAIRRAGSRAADAVMIGDALSDIAAGKAVGARTVLVLTGVTSAAAAAALVDDDRPTGVAADAAELATVLDELATEIAGSR